MTAAAVMVVCVAAKGLVALRGRRYPLALRISSAGACSALCSTKVMSWCSICFHSVSQPLPPRYKKTAWMTVWVENGGAIREEGCSSTSGGKVQPSETMAN